MYSVPHVKHNIVMCTNRAVQARKYVASKQGTIFWWYILCRMAKAHRAKLLLQSTNLAGIWSFTNDSQYTFSRILWNRYEELQTGKVSIHTGCMNWFDSWEYVLVFVFQKRPSAYSFDFMEGAINGFGFHLPPQGPSGVTCSMNLFTSWILPRSCYMKTHTLKYNFINSLTYLAQMYLFLPGPVKNPIYIVMDLHPRWSKFIL